MEFLSSIPSSIIFSLVAFIGAWAVSQYKITDLQKKVMKLEIQREEDKESFSKQRDLDQKAYMELRDSDKKMYEDRFRDMDFQREKLKDNFTERLHTMDKKLTEIHTIITKGNN